MSSPFTPVLSTFLRSLTITIGFLAVVWGIRTFQIFWTISEADDTAYRITTGEPFQARKLVSILLAEGSKSDAGGARYLRSLAIIRLRLAELKMADVEPHKLASEEKAKIEASLVKALEWAPSDSYLWLTLYWVQNEEPLERRIAPLRMSYLYGPNEGWIAAIRNALVMNIFASLPRSIQIDALAEFKHLVTSGYATETAEIFIGPGWPIHERLLELISTTPAEAKQKFAKALHSLNDDIVVPGVVYTDHKHDP